MRETNTVLLSLDDYNHLREELSRVEKELTEVNELLAKSKIDYTSLEISKQKLEKKLFETENKHKEYKRKQMKAQFKL